MWTLLTRVDEGAVAPDPRAQRREEDDQDVVAGEVAPGARVSVVEAVAAADEHELGPERLEVHRLERGLAVREDAGRVR